MFFEQLNFYYDSYIKYFKVNQKIILLKQIKSREKMFILLHENKKISLDTLILNEIRISYDFKTYRYLYLLSKIKISEKNVTSFQKIFLQFIKENLYNEIYLNHLHYILLSIRSLSLDRIEVEKFIISLKNKPIFNLYIKDFIMLLGYFGSENSIKLFMKLIDAFPNMKEEFFWSIGKIIALNNNISKITLEKYVNYLIKYLNRKSTILYSDNCFFSLIVIILKFSNHINGSLLNKLSNTIFICKENFLIKKLLLKVLANLPLNELEYNIFFKKLNKNNL